MDIPMRAYRFAALTGLDDLTLHAVGVRPVIDRVYPFTQAATAFARLQSQAHIGKLLIGLEHC